jgi:hypothetical protein
VQAEGVHELTLVATFYCLGLAGLFLGLWMYYDRRDHARFEAERRRTPFHCVRCDQLYALPGEQGMGACPHCGHRNTPLHF